MGVTADRNDPRLGEVDETGMQKAYLVLSDDERKRGWVRPLRRSYTHVGPTGPQHPLRDLTGEETTRYMEYGYVKYEDYEGEEGKPLGRFWTQAQLDKVGNGCRVSTKMGLELCETYAKQPSFYGRTFCVGCREHLDVEEFVWDEDGQRVGS